MNTLQLLLSVVFVAALVVAYGKDIFAWVKARLPKLPNPLPLPAPVPVVGAQDVVTDLMTVATLRDKFAATNCQEGVDACSILLKIIIDHKHPHAG